MLLEKTKWHSHTTEKAKKQNQLKERYTNETTFNCSQLIIQTL